MIHQLEQIARIKISHPDNIAVRCFDPEYFRSLAPKLQKRLLDCIRSGIEIPESEVGCYANHPDDYDILEPFFSRVVRSQHGVDDKARHRSDWSSPPNSETGEDGALSLGALGLAPLSMRVRVGRNLHDMPMTPAMTRADRLLLEDRMLQVFQQLQTESALAGSYVSITPGHPLEIGGEDYQRLVAEHVMFKDMSGDRFLTAAGISADWPHGRGCYVSNDRSFIVWVGEEDHLRIMYMQRGDRLDILLERLRRALDLLQENPDISFAHSDIFGSITTCPSNLGTGMRASVHLPLPKLTADGSDKRVKALAAPLGLAIRGLGGEHTPIGQDGTVDVSPKARFCITEGEIMDRLFRGIAGLLAAENAEQE